MDKVLPIKNKENFNHIRFSLYVLLPFKGMALLSMMIQGYLEPFHDLFSFIKYEQRLPILDL